MDEATPSLAEKLRSIGISASYASQIMTGFRPPSLALALRIHREIGEKLGPIAGATDDEIKALERVIANRQRTKKAA